MRQTIPRPMLQTTRWPMHQTTRLPTPQPTQRPMRQPTQQPKRPRVPRSAVVGPRQPRQGPKPDQVTFFQARRALCLVFMELFSVVVATKDTMAIRIITSKDNTQLPWFRVY